MKDIANKFKKKTESPVKKVEDTIIIKDDLINDKNYYNKLKKELNGVKISKSSTVYVDEEIMPALQMIKAITRIPISVFVTSVLKKELKKHEKDYIEILSKKL